ncbi:DHA2 family efflux MFS transporter permease subunit [Clostridium aminobutyricum]|uniref:DHA2 family efflux MFS transporter permease subunit n=1 Tax=Clostridium aminobutyricum TaxID=33953 RepID=A0A939IGE9_CLOAM|nr:DHA2 family efflux MFS transporter permease subunit [Clostridium aminobutyricum]MBN7771807.1 DHA2 family efflux MFS transporter permease subunit [Clostridium aminobutyricum]
MNSSTDLKEQAKIPMVPLLVVVVGAFMSFLDSSIVNVALPHMMSVFGISSSDMQWVLTAYMLTSGIVIPTSAFLCKRFGHRRVYIVSLTIFTIGSALCGISWNLSTIIAARIIQAIGGGLVIPVSMAIVYFLAPREKMGMAMGIWGLGAILGPSIGPTLGGYIVDTWSWEWIFFVNLPIGILTVLLCPFYLKETPTDKSVKFDLLGTVFIAVTCFSLLLALSKGTDWGWTSQSIISLFLISGFVLVAFIVWEGSIEHPLIDIRVFKNKVVLASMMAMSLLTIGMMGVIFVVPLYSENLLGYSPLKTGLIMMPMALVSAVMMPISGKLYDKLGAFKIGLVGVIIAMITTLNLQRLGLDTSSGDLQVMLAVRSLGFGLALMPIGNTAMAAVPEALASSTSAIVNTIRQVAGSMGIAAINYIIVIKQAYHQEVLRDLIHYGSYPAYKTMTQLQAAFMSTGMDSVSAQGSALATINGWIVRQGAMDAITDSIAILVLMMVMALPFIFLLSPKQVEGARLRQQKQIQ